MYLNVFRILFGGDGGRPHPAAAPHSGARAQVVANNLRSCAGMGGRGRVGTASVAAEENFVVLRPGKWGFRGAHGSA